MRGKEIYHRDGDRTSLELSSLELRDAPVMTTAAHVAAARLSEPETTETPRGEQCTPTPPTARRPPPSSPESSPPRLRPPRPGPRPDGSYAVRTEDGRSYLKAGATSYVERDGGRFAVTVVPLTPVTELYVRCSYPLRPDVLAASDTCQHPADTAVRDAEGNLRWRCPTHEGELTNGVYGVEVVPISPARAPRESSPMPDTTDTDRFLAEAEPSEITDEQIYETLKQYEAAGVITFILPTEPLGEEWILGVPDGLGGLMKLKGRIRQWAGLRARLRSRTGRARAAAPVSASECWSASLRGTLR